MLTTALLEICRGKGAKKVGARMPSRCGIGRKEEGWSEKAARGKGGRTTVQTTWGLPEVTGSGLRGSFVGIVLGDRDRGDVSRVLESVAFVIHGGEDLVHLFRVCP